MVGCFVVGGVVFSVALSVLFASLVVGAEVEILAGVLPFPLMLFRLLFLFFFFFALRMLLSSNGSALHGQTLRKTIMVGDMLEKKYFVTLDLPFNCQCLI